MVGQRGQPAAQFGEPGEFGIQGGLDAVVVEPGVILGTDLVQDPEGGLEEPQACRPGRSFMKLECLIDPRLAP